MFSVINICHSVIYTVTNRIILFACVHLCNWVNKKKYLHFLSAELLLCRPVENEQTFCLAKHRLNTAWPPCFVFFFCYWDTADGQTCRRHIYPLSLFCFFSQEGIDQGMLNCLRLGKKRPSKKQYKRLNDLLCNSPSWPPLNQSLPPTHHAVIHLS